MEGWSRYYDHGADMPSNLAMMRHVTSNCAGRCLQRVVDTVLNHVPRDSWPNWAVSVGVICGWVVPPEGWAQHVKLQTQGQLTYLDDKYGCNGHCLQSVVDTILNNVLRNNLPNLPSGAGRMGVRCIERHEHVTDDAMNMFYCISDQ